MNIWRLYVRMPPQRGPAPCWIARVVEYEGVALLRIPVDSGRRDREALARDQGDWFRAWLEGRDGVADVGAATWRLRDRALGEALMAELVASHGGERIDCGRYFELLDPTRSMYACMPPRRGEARRWLVKVYVKEYEGEQELRIPSWSEQNFWGDDVWRTDRDQREWFHEWLDGRDGVKAIEDGAWDVRDLALAEALIEELVTTAGAERVGVCRYSVLSAMSRDDRGER